MVLGISALLPPNTSSTDKEMAASKPSRSLRELFGALPGEVRNQVYENIMGDVSSLALDFKAFKHNGEWYIQYEQFQSGMDDYGLSWSILQRFPTDYAALERDKRNNRLVGSISAMAKYFGKTIGKKYREVFLDNVSPYATLSVRSWENRSWPGQAPDAERMFPIAELFRFRQMDISVDIMDIDRDNQAGDEGGYLITRNPLYKPISFLSATVRRDADDVVSITCETRGQSGLSLGYELRRFDILSKLFGKRLEYAVAMPMCSSAARVRSGMPVSWIQYWTASYQKSEDK